MTAPAQTSLRSTKVRRPSFHCISSCNVCCLLRFFEREGWATESGLSKRYGSAFEIGDGGEYSESESLSRHSVIASVS